jgi:hypothetical protein
MEYIERRHQAVEQKINQAKNEVRNAEHDVHWMNIQ